MPCHPRPAMALLLAAAALSAQPAAPAEEALGRLFFTPEWRRYLDRQRLLAPPEPAPGTEAPETAGSGTVQRSNGRRSAWVHGRLQHDDPAPAALEPRHRHHQLGQVVQLPPGSLVRPEP